MTPRKRRHTVGLVRERSARRKEKLSAQWGKFIRGVHLFGKGKAAQRDRESLRLCREGHSSDPNHADRFPRHVCPAKKQVYAFRLSLFR